MLIARWLFLLAGLAACVSVVLFLVTRKPVYWVLARRIFAVTLALGILFFSVLVFERLVLP